MVTNKALSILYLLGEAEEEDDQEYYDKPRFSRGRHSLPPLNRPLTPRDMDRHYKRPRKRDAGYTIPLDAGYKNPADMDLGRLARKTRGSFKPHEHLTLKDLPEVFKFMLPEVRAYIRKNFGWIWKIVGRNYSDDIGYQTNAGVRTMAMNMAMEEIQIIGRRFIEIGTLENLLIDVRRKLTKEERVYVRTHKEEIRRMYVRVLLMDDLNYTGAVNHLIHTIRYTSVGE